MYVGSSLNIEFEAPTYLSYLASMILAEVEMFHRIRIGIEA
jgi:hypothetical protein